MLSAARLGDVTTHGGAIVNGAGNVFINGLPAALALISIATCAATHGAAPIVTGSGSVFIQGVQAVRIGDISGCGAVVGSGSGNVFIG